MSPEPLFTVRVLSDSGTDWAAILVPVLASLAGLWVGGWVTSQATRKVEKERYREETRLLALSIEVEICAARDILQRTLDRVGKLPQQFHIDTAIYGEAIEDPLPITRAAAGTVGRFDPSVSKLIATLLADVASVMQANRIIRNMGERQVLTIEKLAERQAFLLPFINDMRSHADQLVSAIQSVYGGTVEQCRG
jgi:hypothetical protein